MSLIARRGLVFGAGGLAALALAGCGNAPPAAGVAEITFSHLPPIALDVATIELVEEFVAPLEPPHVEGDLPVAPAEAARRWVTDRLVAVGSTRVARVILLDGAATEEDLTVSGGISGLFTDEQAKRYTTGIAMRLEIVDEGTRFVEGFATARATQSTTIPEDATLNERDDALLRMVETLMADFDQGFELTIRRHLGRFVR